MALAFMPLALGVNPIRKVVNMLQALREEAEKEGEMDKKMFDKAMCLCKDIDAKTVADIEENESRVTTLTSEIKELAGSNAQLASEIKELN